MCSKHTDETVSNCTQYNTCTNCTEQFDNGYQCQECDAYLCKECGSKMIKQFFDRGAYHSFSFGYFTPGYYDLYQALAPGLKQDYAEECKQILSANDILDVNSWKLTLNTAGWWVRNSTYIVSTLLCLLMIRPINAVFAGKHRGNYLLIDSMVLIYETAILIGLTTIFKVIQFVISRVCEKSQTLSFLIQWLANVHGIFYVYGFGMALFRWG
eukprot:56486_1